jgi:hypothetical protein
MTTRSRLSCCTWIGGLRHRQAPKLPAWLILSAASLLPPAWTLTDGNRNDVTQLIPLLDGVPAVTRPRRAPTQAARSGDR